MGNTRQALPAGPIELAETQEDSYSPGHSHSSDQFHDTLHEISFTR